MNPPITIISASGTLELCQNLGKQLNLPVIAIKPEKFPNQELKLKIDQVGDTTILVGSFSSPVNTRIMEYVLAADAIKRQGCKQIIGVISYLAYSKQDKVFLPGEPLSAKVVAQILQAAPISKFITLDLHNPRIVDYFTSEVSNLSSVPLMAEYAKKHLKPNSIVVSPDKGSQKNSKIFADYIGLPKVYASKTRDLRTGLVTITDLSQEVVDCNVYIFDDMIATGSTLIELSEYLKSKGALSINVYCTHHLYLNQVQQKLDNSSIDSITVTNSISIEKSTSPKLNIIDCSPIIGAHLKNEVVK